MRRREQNIDRFAAVEAIQISADRFRRLDRVPHGGPVSGEPPQHRGTLSGDDVVPEDGLVDVVPFRDLLHCLIHRRDAATVNGVPGGVPVFIVYPCRFGRVQPSGRGVRHALEIDAIQLDGRRIRIRKQDAECLECRRGLNFSHR